MAEELSLFERYKQRVKEARENDRKIASKPVSISAKNNPIINNTGQRGCGCGRKK